MIRPTNCPLLPPPLELHWMRPKCSAIAVLCDWHPIVALPPLLLLVFSPWVVTPGLPCPWPPHAGLHHTGHLGLLPLPSHPPFLCVLSSDCGHPMLWHPVSCYLMVPTTLQPRLSLMLAVIGHLLPMVWPWAQPFPSFPSICRY